MKCRFCGAVATLPFVDLVNAPPSNSYLTAAQLDEPESYFPLKVFVCEQCWLVQVDEYRKSDEIFDAHYAYFSSFSPSWLRHSRDYVQAMTARLGLGGTSFVVEVASNDGYLLQYFNEGGIPCLGVEPTAGTAAAARAKGVETVEAFFGTATARRLVAASGARPTSCSATTSSPTCPTSTTSPRASASPSSPAAWSPSSSPTC